MNDWHPQLTESRLKMRYMFLTLRVINYRSTGWILLSLVSAEDDCLPNEKYTSAEKVPS